MPIGASPSYGGSIPPSLLYSTCRCSCHRVSEPGCAGDHSIPSVLQRKTLRMRVLMILSGVVATSSRRQTRCLGAPMCNVSSAATRRIPAVHIASKAPMVPWPGSTSRAAKRRLASFENLERGDIDRWIQVKRGHEGRSIFGQLAR